MKLDLHYVEPRLVALYESDNPLGVDTDFYLELADELQAKTIVDLGCGTGILTRELTSSERLVIGVDPAPEMLKYGKQQPGAELVTWVEGDASQIGKPDADLAIMTGNVAQVFLDDKEWLDVLRSLHGALCVGGKLAFESRNPLAKPWERWNREATYKSEETPFGKLTSWLEVTDVSPKTVTFVAHNLFHESDEHLIVKSTLRFRRHEEIVTSLREAGFANVVTYGGWRREPFSKDRSVMVFVAQHG